MDLPTSEEQDAILAERLRDLRMRHYTLELDLIAARASGAADTPAVVARLVELQKQIESAYDALKKVGNE